MANQLYTKAKEDFLSGLLNLSSNTVSISLIDTGVYTFSIGHEDRADIANTAVVATANLASKSVANGVFDAADVVFTSVSGANCEALVLFHDTGDQATSRLIAYIDSATGLPVIPNGGDITVRFSDGANKIFAL